MHPGPLVMREFRELACVQARVQNRPALSASRIRDKKNICTGILATGSRIWRRRGVLSMSRKDHLDHLSGHCGAYENGVLVPVSSSLRRRSGMNTKDVHRA